MGAGHLSGVRPDLCRFAAELPATEETVEALGRIVRAEAGVFRHQLVVALYRRRNRRPCCDFIDPSLQMGVV